ncbi:MAG: hypothetical protein DWP92_03115 [Armatimonadetes bacterium]|nr:MAG: hypothetical protein DWP92_03115 [Armatimonadota bacterium]
MKIRLTDAEIRIRLTQTEVDRLGSGDPVTAHVFDGLSFTVQLTSEEVSALAIDAGSVLIGVPRSKVVSPAPDTPLVHEFQHSETAVVIELDLGRRPR